MKKKTDYIEDEGMAYDEDLREEFSEEEKEAAVLERAIHERRMHNWERAMIMTQDLCVGTAKAIKREFYLRIAQLAAIGAIAVILLVR